MVSVEIQAEPTPLASPGIDETELSYDSGSDENLGPDPTAHVVVDKALSDRAAFNAALEQDALRLEKIGKTSGSKHGDESKRIIDKARAYQKELFELAKISNVIAVLDTGSGKTLIACLLMRWMALQEDDHRDKGRPPRIAFFLVNSVHLVTQQSAVLAENLASPPKALWGSKKKKDDLSREGWRKIVMNNTAVVCTAEILNKCLAASHIAMSEISLLVFDEAHHAKKDHPMARIIIDYFLPTEENRRPKIFGMTASPMNTKGNVRKAIDSLEEFLQSRVATTLDMTLLAHAPKPTNVLWEYERLPLPSQTDLCTKLSQLCYIEELREYFEFARLATSELGSWMSDRLWLYTLGSKREVQKTLQRFEQSRAYVALGSAALKTGAIRRIEAAAEIVKQHHFCDPTATSDCLSSKVLLLYDRLASMYSANEKMRCIVFVDRRLTAQLLFNCFKQLKIKNLLPDVLLGVNQSGPTIDQAAANSKKQEEIMELFRTGCINCVFATSVAEEGIDIPQCSLVVRFDLFKSPIQYMQSRGRARLPGSIYAMMVEERNQAQRDEIQYAVEMETYIKDVCKELPKDRILGTSASSLARLKAIESTKISFGLPGRTRCNYGNSRSILSRYADSLRHEGGNTYEPAFELHINHDAIEERFRFHVTLTGDSGTWSAWGEACRNKSLAKSSAALSLCWDLRQKGELDEDLDSIHVRKRPDNANAQIAVSEKKNQYPMKTKPDFWNHDLGTIPCHLHATLLSLNPTSQLERPHAPLLLLTRQALPAIPSFNVFLGSENVQTEVVCKQFRESLEIDKNSLELLTSYTLDGVFSDVFNKVYQKDSAQMSYWLAPTTLTGAETFCGPSLQNMALRDLEIDHASLQAVANGRVRWLPGDSGAQWCHKFLVDPRNGKYHYFSLSIVEGANIDSPIPDTAKEVADKGKLSVIDFTDSLWKKSKQYFMRSRDPDQPVLSADLVTARRNFLDISNDKASSIPCHICPQPLEVSSLVPCHAASALVWPAILHRLESYLITGEGFAKLEIDVPLDLSLEAFTKDSNSEDSENQIHSGSLRGMGKNYERLEFIGDSLLKMTTTIMVYLKYNSDEFHLHVTRMEMLSNKNLFEKSTLLELFRYARSSSFNRETWYPENLVLLKGRGVKKVPEPVKHAAMAHDLGQKTIADISEAIIGAALLATKDQPSSTKFDLAIKAVTKLVSSENHNITKWVEILPLYQPPTWSLLHDSRANKLAAEVFLRTGYQFQAPRLLRSAMTHPSNQNSPIPDLQRLEFLGDAILDMVCINWMFEKYPDRNPQWLTEHKMAMVSNKFLAALAIDLQFDQLMLAANDAVDEQVKIYAGKVRAFLDQGKKNIREDFWVDITNPPKSLSDLIESYIGAVLVDSDFDYSQIEKFFEKHILWYFKSMEMYDTFANRQPTSYLYRKLTHEYGCRDFKLLSSETTSGEVEIMAGMLIHSKVVAKSYGTSSRHAKARTSKACLALLDGVTIGEFRERYGCYCRRDDDSGQDLNEEEEMDN